MIKRGHLAVAAAGAGLWATVEIAPRQRRLLPPDGRLLYASAQAARLIPGPAAAPDPLAEVGERLFFDQALSRNGNVSCATCHDPQDHFSDQLPRAQGLGTGSRRTPRLLFLKGDRKWFFWDGRALSLEEQSVLPLTHPLEHGLGWVEAAAMLLARYPDELAAEVDVVSLRQALAAVPPEASPAPVPFATPEKVGTYLLASLERLSLQNEVLSLARRGQASVGAAMLRAVDVRPAPLPQEAARWEAAPDQVRQGCAKIFSWFGRAVAAFEATITIHPGRFDAALASAVDWESLASSPHLSPLEVHGMELFFGVGSCHSCHSGPEMSDGEFHNIGLPLKARRLAEVDAGRSVGLLIANAAGGCQGPERPAGCDTLAWLDQENLEFVGAFRTPSLRGVATQAYFMHDGSIAGLGAVLDHYATLPPGPHVGHREETLRPLGLSREEKQALEAFLGVLTGPVSYGSGKVAGKVPAGSKISGP